jgi:hypothetical protein
MNQPALLQSLRDVDYFLLREYYIMTTLIDRSPSGADEIDQIVIRVNALMPQRDRLESVMDLIKQEDPSEFHRQIVMELDIIRRYFTAEIRYAKRRVPMLLNPDDSRLSEYVTNLSQVLKVYEAVFNQSGAVPSPKS